MDHFTAGPAAIDPVIAYQKQQIIGLDGVLILGLPLVDFTNELLSIVAAATDHVMRNDPHGAKRARHSILVRCITVVARL